MKTHMRATAFHFVDNLGTGLYESEGQRVMELIRNALPASMPDPKRWEPKRAKIELSLVANHPLANSGPAFLCLDHGRSLTDPDFDRYFNWLGTPISKLREDANGNRGDSQKGIGRLAALALNEKCLDEDVMVRIKHGYYLLGRTSKTGKIRFVTFIPERAEEDGIEIDRFIDPTATEMGPLKGIQGSFTAIVVPTPIFKSHAEIYEAIKWFLPREQDKMFELLIGGKAMQPPPLERDLNITSEDGRYRARLGVGTTASDGVWLCDDETGFRVASCQKMASKLVPDPLWYPDLVGDIFAPGLLRHQNTARSTLAKEFTRSKNKEWQRLKMFLVSQVAPAGKQLIERDVIKGDAAEILDELAEMFNERFGEPGDDGPDEPPRPPRERSEPGPGGPPNPGGGEGDEDEPGGKKQRRRYVTIKVRNEVYKLYRGQTLDPYIFAQVSFADPHVINVNVRGGYRPLPRVKQERREHCLMQILIAIGRSKLSLGTVEQAVRFANEVRCEFLK
jgi:hypothetical protein